MTFTENSFFLEQNRFLLNRLQQQILTLVKLMISRETLKTAIDTIDDTQLEILHRIILAFSKPIPPYCKSHALRKYQSTQRQHRI